MEPRNDSPRSVLSHLMPEEVGRRQVSIAGARALGVVVALTVAYFLAPFDGSGDGRLVWRAIAAFGTLAFIVVMQIRAVARADRPMLRAIEGLSVAVSLLIVVSASIYLGLSHNAPGAFSERLDHVGALYLAMMTMTTVGFGDIAAVSRGARIAVMMQMVANFAVLVVATRATIAVVRSSAERRNGEGHAAR
jgi:hypothetical protein